MCCLLTSEALVRVGVRGVLVVLEARVRSRGRGLTGPGRSLVSMVLTSQAHRRCAPRKNRRIPTIPAGNIGGRLVHVSAVDTRPRGSESAGFLVTQPGAVEVWNHRHNCLRPCVVRRAQPPPPGSHHTSPTSWPQTSISIRRPREGPQATVQRRLCPHRAGSAPLLPRAGSAPLLPRVGSSRPAPRGSGSTDHGLCALHEDPTHPKYPQPSSSSTPPSCSTSRRHRQPPQ